MVKKTMGKMDGEATHSLREVFLHSSNKYVSKKHVMGAGEKGKRIACPWETSDQIVCLKSSEHAFGEYMLIQPLSHTHDNRYWSKLFIDNLAVSIKLKMYILFD